MTVNNDILIIDKDQSFLDYLIGVLKATRHTIHTAMEMRGALSALSKHPVGLIISGNQLQDISGYDFLRFLKSDPLREAIPLMFLVSIKEQGRAFTAFELGAVDFLVHPIDPEILSSRIDEVLKNSSSKDNRPREDNKSRETTAVPDNLEYAPQQEKDQGLEKALPNLNIEVSRDGVIWLPAIVKRFSEQSLFIETSLFGKAGVRLMLRFKLTDGTFVANSHIKDITFDDFQKPAGLAIAMEDDEAWQRIHADLEKTASTATQMQQAEKDEIERCTMEIQKTILLQSGDDDQDITGTQMIREAEKKKTSYDIRFYNSLIGKQMDNYRVLSLIGAGTMGGVLQGWDVALEREVALKIISYELSSQEKFRDMFIKEARLVSRLNHPNIAQIYSIGSSNEFLYYAMEFIEGETLKDIIKREGNLKSVKGLEYLLAICEALDFVYRNSVVHRDIKPANIMINNMGSIKLLDFGVAKARDSKTTSREKEVTGTPLYMSPEQIAGLALDHRSDMYSLGATFYHAFCGSPPFESKNFKEILNQHLESPIVPLKEKNAKTDPTLCKIIEKMLSKDPNDRFKDFQTIADKLKKLQLRIGKKKLLF